MGEPGPETDGAIWVADEIRKVKKKNCIKCKKLFKPNNDQHDECQACKPSKSLVAAATRNEDRKREASTSPQRN